MSKSSDPLGPFDLFLERALLSILLTTPETPHLREQIASIVQADDFHDRRHQVIFQAVADQPGKPVDAWSLIGLLQQQGSQYLGMAGGEAYIAEIASLAPSFLMAEEYAQQIAKLAQWRRLLDVGEQIKLAATYYQGEPTQALAHANRLLEEIGERSTASVGWDWRTLHDAYVEEGDRQYILAGLLPVPSLSTFYGTPGALKTMLVQDLAFCVVSGQPWLPGQPGSKEVQPFEVAEAPVVWIDVDNGLDRTQRRFRAIGQSLEVLCDAPLSFVSFPSPPFVASDQTSIEKVLARVAAVKARLVVFDNLGTISGGADENSSQMVAVMAGLRQIAEQGTCAVIVIHHKSKGTRARIGDSLRGHSSIEGALDVALLVERDEGKDTVVVRSTKTRDRLVRPFAAAWTYEQDQARELVKGRFYGLPQPAGAGWTRKEQAEACILAEMEDGMSQSQIVNLAKEKAGVGRQTTRKALQCLVDDRKLRTSQKQARGRIHYYRVA